MKRGNIKITAYIFISIFIFTHCNRYNSDKVNTEMIQGKWLLTEAERIGYDTIEIDYEQELTYLVFDGNKCSQYMSDLKDTINFTFLIHDYDLELYEDSIPFRKLFIDILTSDSLVLSFKDDKWKYKKIEQ